jgi:putative Mn2+ efflux pump MntP
MKTKPESCREAVNTADLRVLIMLAIATSIDALAVGVSFAFFSFSILVPVLIIGIVTFVFSASAVYIGNRVGDLFGNKVEILGGLILFAIGAKILLQDLGLLQKMMSLLV